MKGPPLDPGGEDITWPDQVAPRGRKTSSTRKIKPQTSNLHHDNSTVEHKLHRLLVAVSACKTRADGASSEWKIGNCT